MSSVKFPARYKGEGKALTEAMKLRGQTQADVTRAAWTGVDDGDALQFIVWTEYWVYGKTPEGSWFSLPLRFAGSFTDLALAR